MARSRAAPRTAWADLRAGLVLVVVAVAAALPATGAQADAHAVTSVTMVSEADEYVGQGTSYLFHPGSGDVQLSGSPGSVTLKVSDDASGDYFTLKVAPPPDEQLVPGTYTKVQRAADRHAGWAGLDVYGSGRGCGGVSGRFTVVDIASEGNTVTRLHVLFEHHCEEREPALFGEIRYQVPGGDSDLLLAPSQVQWPSTHPAEPARAVPVTVENTGAGHLAVGTPLLSGDDRSEFVLVDSTCPASLPPGQRCAADVRFAPSHAGPASATLTFPDSPALAAQQVLLRGEGEGEGTSWRMRGDPGEHISGGRSYSWTPAEATITAEGGDTGVTVAVEAPEGAFTATFAPGETDAFFSGASYANARRHPSRDGSPGLDVSGSGRSCDQLEGSFTVHEFVDGPDGLVRFSATYEQRCEGAEPTLVGSLTYRASEPARPLPGEPEPPPEPEPDDNRFVDTVGTTHERAIAIVAQEGIAAGYPDRTYRPGQAVTRGQMATFLARALELPPAESAGFSDTGGHAHEQAIDAIAAQGIASGFSDGSFRPQLVVTRAQMASFLQRALDLPPGEASSFRDTTGDVHARAIDAVAAADIAQGYDDGTYRPGLSVTRGQMASLLVRALDLS